MRETKKNSNSNSNVNSSVLLLTSGGAAQVFFPTFSRLQTQIKIFLLKLCRFGGSLLVSAAYVSYRDLTLNESNEQLYTFRNVPFELYFFLSLNQKKSCISFFTSSLCKFV